MGIMLELLILILLCCNLLLLLRINSKLPRRIAPRKLTNARRKSTRWIDAGMMLGRAHQVDLYQITLFTSVVHNNDLINYTAPVALGINASPRFYRMYPISLV